MSFNEVFPIRPIGNRFVAEVVEGDEELKIDNSEFILPKNNNSKPMRAKVVEISDDFDNSGLGLRVGDIVLLPKYGSTVIRCGKDGKLFQLCLKDDVIGIV